MVLSERSNECLLKSVCEEEGEGGNWKRFEGQCFVNSICTTKIRKTHKFSTVLSSFPSINKERGGLKGLFNDATHTLA